MTVPRLRYQLTCSPKSDPPDGEVTVDDSALSSLVHDRPPSRGCSQLEQRLQLVLSRAPQTHLEVGFPFTVDEALAQDRVPPARGRTLHFAIPMAKR